MPFSITTQDGITINNIPDDIDPNSDVLRQRVADIRASGADVPREAAQLEEGGLTETILEPLAAIGTGVLGEIAGGVAGLATALTPGLAPGSGAGVTEGVRERITREPTTQAGQAGLEALGGLIQKGVDLANIPISGITAILELVDAQGIDQAAETLKNVQEQGLSKTVVSRLEEAGAPPSVLAGTEAIISGIPDIIGGGVGVAASRSLKATTKASTAKAQKAIEDIEIAKTTPTEAAQVPAVEDVADIIKTGTHEELADIVKADPEFFRAADELGISSEPLSSFASKNTQFVDIENALRKVPGSLLEPQFKEFVTETAQKADDLIVRYGGTIDKAQLGLDFKRQSLQTVDDLFQQADDAYGSLTKVLPRAQRVPANNTVSFIRSLSEEVGGVKQLPPKLKRMLSKLEPTEKAKTVPVFDLVTGKTANKVISREVTNPTLGIIDQFRREVGQAINSGSGSFKDVEKGLNKALYARLTRDQDVIADAAGFSNLTDAAKGLVRQRKQIEDNLVTLFGKDLNQALNVNVSGAIKGLQKGQIDRFKEIMSAIPEAKRGEVALSAMNDVFKGTAVGTQQLSPTQFVKWMDTLNRSPAAKKALFDELPQGSQKAIENLFTVSKGISRAQQATIPTGRINALFDPETGFIRKMVGKTIPTAVAFTTGSPVAAVATNATLDFIRQGTNGAKRASDLMASQEFQSIIRDAVKDGVVEGGQISDKLLKAQAKLEKTKRYQSWAESLGSPERSALAGGLLTYLFQTEVINENN